MTTLADAIEHLRTGDWEAAHTIVQERDDTAACWAHAIVHLQEGDTANAGYWYRRAGRQPAGFEAIDREIAALAATLLTSDNVSSDGVS